MLTEASPEQVAAAFKLAVLLTVSAVVGFVVLVAVVKRWMEK